MAEEGARAFFRGNTAGLALYAAYGWVQFPVYSMCKSVVQGPLSSVLSSSLGAGCTAGAAATVATYPLDLARTRLAMQGVPRVHRHMWDVLSHAFLTGGGVRGVFAGLVPTLLQIVPAAGATFVLYEWFHGLGRRLADVPGAKLAEVPPKSSHSALGGAVSRRLRAAAPVTAMAIASGSGIMAGACSKLLVLPLDTVRRRMQASGAQAGDRRLVTSAGTNAVAVARAIVRAEGVWALWRGATPALLKAGLGSWATFAGYELMQHLLAMS
jgi:solute carrier family 25 thiamine pyrophosphate transporter 19